MSKIRYKSKRDLTKQIQRIYATYGSHRLYNTALSICLIYNQNMSDTKENILLFRQYCEENSPQLKAEILESMETMKYPMNVYMSRK